jgi:hypothetical protein
MGKLNKIHFTIFFVCTLLLLSSVSFAAGEVTLVVSQKDITMYSGESTVVNVTIQNNQNFLEKVSITVFPQYWSGITATLQQYVVNVNPNSNSTVKLFFDVSECAEEATTTFTVTAKSTTNEAVQDSKSIRIGTIRKYPVCISDIKLDKYVLGPGETIKIETSVTNPAETYSMPVTLQTTISSVSGIVQRFDDRIETIAGKTVQKISNEYTFSKYADAGSYSVNVVLKDFLNNVVSSKTVDFRISEVENVVHTKNVKWGLLTQTIYIIVKNEGNVPSKSLYVTESIPVFMKPFFTPRVEPASQETSGGRVVYSWVVGSLGPGEEEVIVYDVSTWNALLIILALVGVVLYAFKYVFRIAIIKRHKHVGPLTREKEIVMSLEVRNRTRHEIKNVLVRDFVPSIATVVERFDTLRPTLRKVAGGTELVWKLDSLGPLDERVLTYRVKPTVDIIGSLKLPKAVIRYTDKERRIRRVISKSIKVKAR